MRDPDGYLIELGQSTGLLRGELAKKRPEDLPADHTGDLEAKGRFDPVRDVLP